MSTSNPSARSWRQGTVSWLLSAAAHTVLLLLLWLCVYSIPSENVLQLYAGLAQESQLSDEFALVPFAVSPEPDSDSASESFSVEAPMNPQSLLSIESLSTSDSVQASHDQFHPSFTNSLMSEMHQASAMTSAATTPLAEALNGRRAAEKGRLLARYGGSMESEAAVELALDWLVRHQAEDGGWSFGHHHVCNGQCNASGNFVQARNGATALALLPFLGAGHTHRAGDHQQTVQDGLRYLLTHMNHDGQQAQFGAQVDRSWFEIQGTMYSHCLATIALSEAYAMTNDSALREPAQIGVNFLVRSQNRVDGGWRYAPGARGDTSVVGWAEMALKSAKVGGLEVPDGVLRGTDRFLDAVSSNGGATYGYTAPDKNPHGLAATSSIGILCRMYGGWDRSHKGLQRGVRALAKIGPSGEHLYYCYYATQVLHHYGGEEWKLWNQQLRDPLIALQVKTGHAAGSWLPNRELDGMAGGRLYATAVSAMILEVYYRHMPLYTDLVLDDDFKL